MLNASIFYTVLPNRARLEAYEYSNYYHLSNLLEPQLQGIFFSSNGNL